MRAILHIEQEKRNAILLSDIPQFPVFSICELEEKINEYFKSANERHGNKGKETKKRRLYYW